MPRHHHNRQSESHTRSRRFRPALDVLEDRLCPSCTATPRAEAEATGILKIIGDDAANVVSITQDHGASDMTVKCDGDQTNYDPALVHKIVVKLKGGDDDFTYRLGGGSDFEDAMAVVAKVGQGNDTVTMDMYNTGDANDFATIKADLSLEIQGNDGSELVNVDLGAVDDAEVAVTGDLGTAADKLTLLLHGDLLGTAKVQVNLLGGDGNDSLTVAGTTDGVNNDGSFIDIDAGATLDIALGGNLNDDYFGTTYVGVLNGQLNIEQAGDRNNDTLAMSLSLKPGSTGTLDAAALGEKNKDTLVFELDNSSGGTATIARALVDGGPGIDDCTASPTVTVVNCET